jgi:hypothetical protein
MIDPLQLALSENIPCSKKTVAVSAGELAPPQSGQLPSQFMPLPRLEPHLNHTRSPSQRIKSGIGEQATPPFALARLNSGHCIRTLTSGSG